MFQYATARSMSLDNNMQLHIDISSGFKRDKFYKRKYELSGFPIIADVATFYESIPFWLHRIKRRLSEKDEPLIQNYTYGLFISENRLAYLPELNQLDYRRDIWLRGYWQSPEYFKKNKIQVSNELMPTSSGEEIYKVASQSIKSAESVALGIRLYEESVFPNLHSKNGEMKSAEKINTAIKRIRDQIPDCRFFVFCTHRAKFLEKLMLPSDTIFLTGDEGYIDSKECLRLISLCKHHIFTNSTFYWWGAWLSSINYPHDNRMIIASDNFVNSDILCPEWERF